MPRIAADRRGRQLPPRNVATKTAGGDGLAGTQQEVRRTRCGVAPVANADTGRCGGSEISAFPATECRRSGEQCERQRRGDVDRDAEIGQSRHDDRCGDGAPCERCHKKLSSADVPRDEPSRRTRSSIGRVSSQPASPYSTLVSGELIFGRWRGESTSRVSLTG